MSWRELMNVENEHFDVAMDAAVQELNQLWHEHGTEMEDIPIETRRRALRLESEMTEAANAGDLRGAREHLNEWRECWTPGRA